jgi:hypothetical protein
MNKPLNSSFAESLLARVSDWPEEAQAELLERLVEIETRYQGVYRLSDEERAAVQRGLAEARQGKFATEEQVARIFDRYRK